jgi:molecular chaperone GrpE (heat shock protein)
MEKIEVFELVIDIDDESGVTAIALVDQPAIDSNWMAFSQQTEYKFAVKDEEKRIIEGYFMVADLLIPRIGENGEKFFVKFSAKTIEQIREKQSRLGLNNNFNLMHDPRQIAEGVYMLDNLIIDNERGKVAPKEFEKVPNGSLWGSAKVDNDEIWEQIKAGEFKGFSVEGMFKQLEPVTMDEETINKIIKTIQDFEKSMYDNVQVTNKQTIDNMSKETLDKVKSLIFGEETTEVTVEATPEVTEIKLMAAELADGTMVNIDPALEVGAVVTVEVEGEVAPMPNGEYPLADGTVVTVMEGAISDIKEVEAEEEEAMETEATLEPKAETVTEAKIRKIIESTETVFNEQFAKLTEELETVKAEFAKYKAEADTKEKAMFTAVEELANESSVATIKKKRSGVISPKKKSIFTVNK